MQLSIKPVRLFGHQDPVSKDHHGPESRWEKQRRRRGKLSRAAKAWEAKAQEARRAP